MSFKTPTVLPTILSLDIGDYSGFLNGTDNIQLTVKSKTLDFTSSFCWHGKKITF